MSGRPPAGHTPPERCAAAAAELGVAIPFGLDEFRGRLERRCGRAVRLVPWDMARTAVSGFLSKTARADYLYYEAHTSPFHQAHIVLTLAAGLLLGGEGTAPVSHSLVSEIGPELIELMLGRPADAPVSRVETETFAFLVLERARRGNRLSGARAYRRLAPLWAMLYEAVPEISETTVPAGIPPTRWRLYRRVTAIRDIALVLRPFRNPAVADRAETAARAAGVTADERAAAIEAAVLAAAAHARRTGQRALNKPCAAEDPLWLGPDLDSEAAWLVKVARALAASPLVSAPSRGRSRDRSARRGAVHPA